MRPPLSKEKGAREDLQDVPTLLLYRTDQEGSMGAQGGLNKAPGQENHLKFSPKTTFVRTHFKYQTREQDSLEI